MVFGHELTSAASWWWLVDHYKEPLLRTIAIGCQDVPATKRWVSNKQPYPFNDLELKQLCAEWDTDMEDEVVIGSFIHGIDTRNAELVHKALQVTWERRHCAMAIASLNDDWCLSSIKINPLALEFVDNLTDFEVETLFGILQKIRDYAGFGISLLAAALCFLYRAYDAMKGAPEKA